MPGTEEVRQLGARLKAALDFDRSPVGVRLLPPGATPPPAAPRLRQHRYCQLVMRAGHGEEAVLDGSGLACPAAARVFGFRPLPANLESGQGLVGFGIVSDPGVGVAMFEAMPHLEPGSLELLHAFPLESAPACPDVVLVEDAIEKLMWLVLAYVNVEGGERVHASTAVLQAVCSDSTVLPWLEQRLNFTYGCYGCREATDIGAGEALVGFPTSVLRPLVEQLESLGARAMPTSRSKRALHALTSREGRSPEAAAVQA